MTGKGEKKEKVYPGRCAPEEVSGPGLGIPGTSSWYPAVDGDSVHACGIES